jgi:tRNA(Glu) U13 pseudouridine synthase TruD
VCGSNRCPEQPTFTALENGDLAPTFALPKGTYATTLLSELAVLDEA